MRSVRTVSRGAVLGLAGASLLGCVNDRQPYPAAWQPLAGNGRCADVIGRFDNAGAPNPAGADQRQTGWDEQPKLVAALFKSDAAAGGHYPSEADTIALTREDAGLRVTAVRGTETIVSVLLANDSMRCDDGWLVVQEQRGATQGRGNPLMGIEHKATRIRRASDGALIVRWDDDAAGLVFGFLPAGGGTRHFERHAHSAH